MRIVNLKKSQLVQVNGIDLAMIFFNVMFHCRRCQMNPSDHLKGDTNKITAMLFMIKMERILKMPNCVDLFNFGLGAADQCAVLSLLYHLKKR